MTLEEKYEILLAVAAFYADPDTYFGTFIVGDRPAGAINDDWSVHHCKDLQYDDDDMRPGFCACKALELVGEKGVTEMRVNYDWLKSKGLYTSYYDKEYKEEMKKRGVIDESDVDD